MIRHLSLYVLNDAAAADDLVAYLKALTDGKPGIAATLATKAVFVPEMPEGLPLAFPHVMQQLDFETPEAAAAWPASQEHQALQAYTADTVKHVTAFDFVI